MVGKPNILFIIASERTLFTLYSEKELKEYKKGTTNFIGDTSDDGKCFIHQFYYQPSGPDNDINASTPFKSYPPEKFIKTEGFKKDKSTVLSKFKIRYNPSNCNIIQCVDLANIKSGNIIKHSESFVLLETTVFDEKKGRKIFEKNDYKQLDPLIKDQQLKRLLVVQLK